MVSFNPSPLPIDRVIPGGISPGTHCAEGSDAVTKRKSLGSVVNQTTLLQLATPQSNDYTDCSIPVHPDIRRIYFTNSLFMNELSLENKLLSFSPPPPPEFGVLELGLVRPKRLAA